MCPEGGFEWTPRRVILINRNLNAVRLPIVVGFNQKRQSLLQHVRSTSLSKQQIS